MTSHLIVPALMRREQTHFSIVRECCNMLVTVCSKTIAAMLGEAHSPRTFRSLEERHFLERLIGGNHFLLQTQQRRGVLPRPD